jgi:hypothetical protein
VLCDGGGFGRARAHLREAAAAARQRRRAAAVGAVAVLGAASRHRTRGALQLLPDQPTPFTPLRFHPKNTPFNNLPHHRRRRRMTTASAGAAR